jgi:hypothetical protein
MRTRALVAALSLALPAPHAAGAPGATQPSVTVTVTVLGGAGLAKGDVRLLVDGAPRPVESWAEDADLHLAILVDDAIARGAGDSWKGLRAFVTAQPATTRVAVAYLRNHAPNVVQDFTTDHEAAAGALRAPRGAGGASNPYRAALELVERWPRDGRRRSILLLSPGVDFFQGIHQSPAFRDVDPLVQAAQERNVNVWAVFVPGGGHRGRNYTHVANGKDSLSRLALATGGEFFSSGPGTPDSLAPFFDEIAAHLASQRLLTFSAAPAERGRPLDLDVTTEAPDAEILAPSAVRVPAGE